MQITMVTHPLPTKTSDGEDTAPAPARQQPGLASGEAVPAGEMPNLWDNEVLRRLRDVAREADSTLPANVRAELALDEATRHIVVRIIEVESNQVVHAYPAEEALRLLARVREELGKLLSATA